MLNARDLLAQLVQRQGSDLHLACGSPPVMRVHGRIQPLDAPALSAADMEAGLSEVLAAEKRVRFNDQRDLDFVYELPLLGRFRGNAFLQHRGSSVVFRVIPEKIPTVDELGLPEVITDLAQLQNGMVLITGAAGVGKSTTL